MFRSLPGLLAGACGGAQDDFNTIIVMLSLYGQTALDTLLAVMNQWFFIVRIYQLTAEVREADRGRRSLLKVGGRRFRSFLLAVIACRLYGTIILHSAVGLRFLIGVWGCCCFLFCCLSQTCAPKIFLKDPIYFLRLLHIHIYLVTYNFVII